MTLYLRYCRFVVYDVLFSVLAFIINVFAVNKVIMIIINCCCTADATSKAGVIAGSKLPFLIGFNYHPQMRHGNKLTFGRTCLCVSVIF